MGFKSSVSKTSEKQQHKQKPVKWEKQTETFLDWWIQDLLCGREGPLWKRNLKLVSQAQKKKNQKKTYKMDFLL